MENGRVRYNLIKWLVLAMAVLASFFVQGQTIFMQEMDVMQRNIKGVCICVDSTKVIWGVKQDTMAYMFLDKYLVYFPVDTKYIKKRKQRKITEGLIHFTDSYNNTNKYKDKLFLVQDFRRELYSIRYTNPFKNGSFLIFICNIEFGLPNYVLKFGPDSLCQNLRCNE